MSYQAHISEPAIKCDHPGCKASSDDDPITRALSRRRLMRLRVALMQAGWVCALGIDLCKQHSNGYGSIAKVAADRGRTNNPQ